MRARHMGGASASVCPIKVPELEVGPGNTMGELVLECPG